MNVLIVYAHPNPESFNNGILETVQKTLSADKHTVRTTDLYAQNFKAVLDAADFELINQGQMPTDIAEQQADVLWANALIFVYPTWWFGLPAILKGWVDRIFQYGFAFENKGSETQGMLGGRKALILQTTGSDEKAHDDMQAHELITKPFSEGTLGFCGITDVTHRVYFGIPLITQEEREAILDEIAAEVRTFSAESPQQANA